MRDTLTLQASKVLICGVSVILALWMDDFNAPKCSGNEEETYQTCTFTERVRIEKTNRNIGKKHASDLNLDLELTQ